MRFPQLCARICLALVLAAPAHATLLAAQGPPPLPLPPPMVVADQAAALLPDAAGDLAQAAAWDRYSLHVVLDPGALTLRGSERLELTNHSSALMGELVFHLYPNHPDFGGMLQVSDVQVAGQPAPTASERGNLILRVGLARPLPPGGSTSVTMQWTARSTRNSSARAYGAFNQEAGVWALATFYPVLARFGADGWDRRPVSSTGDLAVTDTALYDVTIDGPPSWALATTGVRVATQSLDGGGRRDRFVSGPQRDFLLTAMQGLDQASSTIDGTLVVAYYQPGDAASGRLALETAAQALRIFNQRFGRYPLAELEVVEAALTNFLGVEYPGMVLIEQNLYKRGSGLRTTVAHEVAHQWWYSQVGNDAQGDPWLDEGLASFAQLVYYDGLGEGDSVARELQAFRTMLTRARQAGRDGVTARPSAAFAGNYSALVYAKPALFFQALRLRLGDEAFFRFLQTYYATYRYRNASGAGLLAAAQQSCGCDLQGFYRAWITSAQRVDLP